MRHRVVAAATLVLSLTLAGVADAHRSAASTRPVGSSVTTRWRASPPLGGRTVVVNDDSDFGIDGVGNGEYLAVTLSRIHDATSTATVTITVAGH